MKRIDESSPFYYVGEEKSPFTVLYLSLSAEDSLLTSPFCHPVNMLVAEGVKVLSVTLPDHEGNAKPQNIQELWSSKWDIIATFIEKTVLEIQKLPFPINAVMGLSRGAFIGSYLAAQIPSITHILGFAPMTSLLHHLSILSLKEDLATKTIRFFIGHNDTRVHTSEVVTVIKGLIDEALRQKIVFPPIDLVMKPSVGFKGHGTLDPVFNEGVSWLLNNL